MSDAAVRRMERARQAAQAAENRARRAGCFQRGFLIFQPQKPAACRKLEADYNRAENVYRQLAAQVGGGNRPSGGKELRDRVIRALAANNCGSQYARYANANRRSVFSFFLGPQAYVDEPQAPRGGGFRTLCVRTCDGYYFPISFSTFSNYFGQDEQLCRQACPGAEVQLYAYRNPGEQPEEARSPSGEPITSLANAFRYRNEVVEGCTCRVKQEAGGPQNASRVTMTFSPGLVAEDNKDARTVPMPRRRPSRYAISDIENPSVPVEMERKDAQTSAITASDGKRHVRVIGPQFFYAR
ncbi:MAG: DUF2865 domain-containing protein [Rhodobiaceae bacterium]|nr:DUF2865 domain-containing protein [Rhodobiaceae bacterium]